MNAVVNATSAQEVLKLKANAQRACELKIYVSNTGRDDLVCSGYAPRRQFDAMLFLAFAERSQCYIRNGGVLDVALWIGSTFVNVTETEAKKIVETFGIRSES